jgi:hypothetical protein
LLSICSLMVLRFDSDNPRIFSGIEE